MASNSKDFWTRLARSESSWYASMSNGCGGALTPEDVEVIPGRAEVLKRYAAEGYRLLGVSNQSAVS